MDKRHLFFGNGEAEGDPLLAGMITDLFAQGLSPEEARDRLDENIHARLEDAGACLLKGLKKSASAMLADRRNTCNRFQRRLRKKWGHAFDHLRMLVEASREAGEQFNEDRRPKAASQQDYVFDALVRLHARACLISSEVLWQMEGGFSSGAMARWRTLHEIAVVAFFIKDHQQDVAEKYLLHHVVESSKAAVQYQKLCEKLWRLPLDEEQMVRLREGREELRDRFGDDYLTDWGWAASAIGSGRPTFADIERAVNLEHFRPYFKLASFSTHAGCKGIRFDLGMALVQSGEHMMLAGPSDAGMFDPGACTATSIFQATAALLLYGGASSLALVVTEALQQLAMEVEEAFASAEAALAVQAAQCEAKNC